MDSNKFDYGLYSPCLLNKLTDNEPHIRSENYSKKVSVNVIKEDVLNNISMILNSKSRINSSKLQGDSVLLDSVLAFGLEDFCGENKSEESLNKLQNAIIKQIKTFEPRLKKTSLEVKLLSSGESLNYLYHFEISGIIEIGSITDKVVFKTSLDLENGSVKVSV